MCWRYAFFPLQRKTVENIKTNYNFSQPIASLPEKYKSLLLFFLVLSVIVA